MNQRILGKTGVAVSELGLGTCFMAGQGQDGINQCVAWAIDQGINYFDTAADYGKGHDEKMLGIALRGRRDRVFLATKVGCVDEPGGHRRVESLQRQHAAGLARLQTDRVDLIQLHEADQRKWWSDDPVSIAEAGDHCGPLIRDDEEYDFANAPCVEFLRRAQATGTARFIGITGKDARRLARIVAAIEIDAMMMAHQFNPIYRNAGKYLLPVSSTKNIGVVNGAAFMKGWLAVPQTAWRDLRPSWMDETFYRAYFAYLDVHARSGLSLAELSLRWQLAEPRQHSIVVGFSCQRDIQQNIAAVERGPLPAEWQAAVDAVGIVLPLIYQGRSRL
ncbi:MAG: Aldo-keto reductase YhdN [Verrucomicrobiae bacterium]|nr:Aldo-keto reductase YhdN [Verrucomicrobiae bacterium]